MRKYQSQMVDVIAEIHDLYDRTISAGVQMDKRDQELIENLACTVELYFKGFKESKMAIS